MTENNIEHFVPKPPEISPELKKMTLTKIHSLWDEADDKEGLTRDGYTQGEIYAEITRRSLLLKTVPVTTLPTKYLVLPQTNFESRFMPNIPEIELKSNRNVS